MDDEGDQHAERLLRRDDVILQTDQPARHQLHALDLAADSLGQGVFVTPLVIAFAAVCQVLGEGGK